MKIKKLNMQKPSVVDDKLGDAISNRFSREHRVRLKSKKSGIKYLTKK